MTKYLFFPAILCASLISHAQTASWQWLRNATIGDSSFTRSIVTDPSGNIFADGSYLSSSITIGSTTLSNTGQENIFLAKYDNTGTPLWAIGSKGKFSNVAYPMAADASGNAIISGYFLSDTFIIGTDTLLRSLTMEIENAFIAKVSPTGASLWASRPYSNGYTQIEGVATDQAGNIYAAGELSCLSTSDRDYAVFGTDTVYNDTINFLSPDIFVVKYDPTGRVLWAKSFGGSGLDRASSITVDDNNNVLLSGVTQSSSISFGTYTITSPCSFVVKFDGNGNAKWVTTAQGAGARASGGLACDKKGNVFFSGSYTYGDSMTIGSYVLYNDTVGNNMMFVAKTDSNGNVLWANSAGYGNKIFGYVYSPSLVADSLGDVLLTGGFYGYPSLVFGPDTLYDDTAYGHHNFFVMEYDAAGFAAWAASASGPGNFAGEGITSDRSGNIYITGSYSSNAINLGSYSLPVTRGGNTFIAKLSPPQIAAVHTLPQQQQDIKIYPVPSQSDVHVMLPGTGYSAVQVTDMAGHTIWNTQCNIADANLSITIPALSFVPGMYVVTAVHNGSPQSKTIVVR